MPSACIVARGVKQNHQHSWGTAFAEGLRRHGWKAEMASLPKPCDLLVLWGVRATGAIKEQLATGGEVCILERGYIGDRFEWTSVSFGGGLNGRGEFRGARDDGMVRFHKHHAPLKPWRRKDGYALLIGQVPGDMSLAPVKGRLVEWYRDTTRELWRHGWEVRFRQHPLASARGLHEDYGTPIGGSLAEAMAGTGVVVTYNSNTAVDAVLAGVPAIAMDEGSMAWPVTGHDFDAVVRPPRSAWAAKLAWCQWLRDEIASGDCWEAVGAFSRVA